MNQALYINGVFEDVLEEIVEAQKCQIDLMCTIQPYSKNVIKLLEGTDFGKHRSIPYYISTTTDLKHVSYVAEIVGWENKKYLKDSHQRLEQINKQIAKNQPIQAEVYFYSDKEKQRNVSI